MSASHGDTSRFQVGLGTHLLSGAISGFPRFWSMMGKLESWVLSEQLEDIAIDRPVYIAGMARAGTTILLEILASHPQVVTHRYADFPALFTPYWWGQANKNSPGAPAERAHGDGLMVTRQSPEAMEEMLWMAHFDHLHDSSVSNVLDGRTSNAKFEQAYKEHIRKLLLLRRGTRYVAKGNYNLTRIGYLNSIMPDAQFLIPIRNPLNHVASLVKQQRLFSAGESGNPRAVAHLQRVGHFEFGLDRRVINIGDRKTVDAIEQLWADGHEVRGWARYWAMLYGWLHELLRDDPRVCEIVQVIRYEDFCSDPMRILECSLDPLELWDRSVFSNWAKRIKPPSYYQVSFSDDERQAIAEETEKVANVFGYSL